MAQVLPNFLPLGIMALAALAVAFARGGIKSEVGPGVRLAAITVVAQAVHFLEEAATGFPRRVPEMFGREPVSMKLFVAVNMACFVLWGLSLWGLGRGWNVALAPLWFLAIAGVCNALIHPSLALYAGGYVPGLLSAPVTGALGLLLLARLRQVTA